MEVVPASVGAASLAWDEQHLDLAAAAGQIGGAGTGGFTSNVSGTASRFTTAWQRFTDTAGTTCEAQADGLRTAIRDYIASDEAQGIEILLLQGFLEEVR